MTPTPRPPNPPKHLSTDAKKLWRALMDEHVIDDVASRHLLTQLAETFDDLCTAKAVVAREGLMIQTERGRKSHPLLVVIAENRRQTLAIIRALKLDITIDE